MLKYSNKITKLTDSQKIRILSGVGSISGKDMKNLGIPTLAVGNMKNYGRSIYPHTTSICHSWNTGLWSDVAKAKVKMMANEGIGFAIAPGAKIKLSPYRKETTEDPYLASLLSGAYMKAATDAGMRSGASGYYLTEADVRWLDASPNNRILNEYFAMPYAYASEISSSSCVVTDNRTPNYAYADSCEQIRSFISGNTEFFVCEKATEDSTVKLVSEGVICLEGSANALSAALTRYRKLKKLMEEGRDVTLLQLEEEVKNGTAISDEAVDEALDRALDFLFSCAGELRVQSLTEEDENALALKATLESTVLLKNKGSLLPLPKSKSIFIIDAYSPREDENTFVGECKKFFEARGYSVSAEKVQIFDDTDSKHRIDRLVSSVSKGDVILLLLGAGHGAERQIHLSEKLTLPPNQLYLANKFENTERKVISVIFSEHATDVDFTRSFDSVIYAPLPVKYSAQALADIVSGKYNPTGRLAYTLYAGSEMSLKKGAAYIQNYRMKTGPFIGYRYYDMAGLRVGYPFGHGLSYTEFLYSDISVDDDTVSFTVKNCGREIGSEVAQIYVGMDGSAVLRPKKELCGFVKIRLKPMEEKRISIRIRLPKVFCDGGALLEKGKYIVYVGASVSDIRLRSTYLAGDAVLEKNEERLSDYLQSHSNILNDNYTLEANYGVMKKGITNIITGGIALVLSIVLAVFNITTHLGSLVLGIVSGVLALCAIVLLIVEIFQRSRAHADERERIRQENQEHFADAEQIPVLSTDKMFEDQFDTVKEENTYFDQVVEFNSKVDYSEYIDDQFRISDAASEFKRFAFERGYKLDRGVAENLFASLSVSKMLVLNGTSADDFNSLVLLLSEYFGCAVCLDNSADLHENAENVFHGYDSEGYGVKKNIFKALENAASMPDKVHISAIDDITADNAGDWIVPLMRYLRSYKRRNEIVMPDETGKNVGYTIGNNLWIMIRLADTQTADSLPVDILKCASVINLSFVKCQVMDDQIPSHGFTSYQMEHMKGQVAGKYEVSEEIWKKIDKIEKYAKGYSNYTIGNKLWLDVEKHMEILLACGVEVDEAIDAALAIRVLPSITASLKDKLTKEDKTVLQTVEFVFGVDANMQYIKAYIDSLTVKQPIIESVEPEAVEEVTEAIAEEPKEGLAEDSVSESSDEQKTEQ